MSIRRGHIINEVYCIASVVPSRTPKECDITAYNSEDEDGSDAVRAIISWLVATFDGSAQSDSNSAVLQQRWRGLWCACSRYAECIEYGIYNNYW